MNLDSNDAQSGIGQTKRQALNVLSRLGKPTICAADLENEYGYTGWTAAEHWELIEQLVNYSKLKHLSFQSCNRNFLF